MTDSEVIKKDWEKVIGDWNKWPNYYIEEDIE